MTIEKQLNSLDIEPADAGAGAPTNKELEEYRQWIEELLATCETEQDIAARLEPFEIVEG